MQTDPHKRANVRTCGDKTHAQTCVQTYLQHTLHHEKRRQPGVQPGPAPATAVSAAHAAALAEQLRRGGGGGGGGGGYGVRAEERAMDVGQGAEVRADEAVVERVHLSTHRDGVALRLRLLYAVLASCLTVGRSRVYKISATAPTRL